jgi:hypothetical protein
MFACNLEASPSASNDTKDYEIDPTELPSKTVAKDDDECEEEDWHIDTKFCNSDCFRLRYHDGRGSMIEATQYVRIKGGRG